MSRVNGHLLSSHGESVAWTETFFCSVLRVKMNGGYMMRMKMKFWGVCMYIYIYICVCVCVCRDRKKESEKLSDDEDEWR